MFVLDTKNCSIGGTNANQRSKNLIIKLELCKKKMLEGFPLTRCVCVSLTVTKNNSAVDKTYEIC